jgi:hypothetical protein
MSIFVRSILFFRETDVNFCEVKDDLIEMMLLLSQQIFLSLFVLIDVMRRMRTATALPCLKVLSKSEILDVVLVSYPAVCSKLKHSCCYNHC